MYTTRLIEVGACVLSDMQINMSSCLQEKPYSCQTSCTDLFIFLFFVTKEIQLKHYYHTPTGVKKNKHNFHFCSIQFSSLTEMLFHAQIITYPKLEKLPFEGKLSEPILKLHPNFTPCDLTEREAAAHNIPIHKQVACHIFYMDGLKGGCWLNNALLDIPCCVFFCSETNKMRHQFKF